MYNKPTIIEIKRSALSTYIQAYANSSIGIGCPGSSKDYVVGGGCGHVYNIGGCDITHNT